MGRKSVAETMSPPSADGLSLNETETDDDEEGERREREVARILMASPGTSVALACARHPHPLSRE